MRRNGEVCDVITKRHVPIRCIRRRRSIKTPPRNFIFLLRSPMLRHDAADVLQVPAEATQEEVRREGRRSSSIGKERATAFFFFFAHLDLNLFSSSPRSRLAIFSTSDPTRVPRRGKEGPPGPRRKRLGVQARRGGLLGLDPTGSTNNVSFFFVFCLLSLQRRISCRFLPPHAPFVLQRHDRARTFGASGAGGCRSGAR